MPLTIKQIIANSSRDRILLSREVSVTNIRSGKERSTGCTVVKATTHSPFNPRTGARVSRPERYDTRVKGLEPGKSLSRQYVEVDCTCSDFWATWEFALNKKGAAQIRRSNGEPPDVKNPQHVAGTCKHCLALFNKILQGGM